MYTSVQKIGRTICTDFDFVFLFVCCHSAEKPGLRGAADAPQCLGSHDGERDWGAQAALHCQKTAHSGCHGCQEETTTELLNVPRRCLLPLVSVSQSHPDCFTSQWLRGIKDDLTGELLLFRLTPDRPELHASFTLWHPFCLLESTLVCIWSLNLTLFSCKVAPAWMMLRTAAKERSKAW